MKDSNPTQGTDAAGCPGRTLTRRDFLRYAAVVAALPAASLPGSAAPPHPSTLRVPRAPISIRFCPRYEYRNVKRTLGRMLDELGDVRRLVRRQHVTVKLNLVNSSEEDLAGIPVWLTVTAHPVVALALGRLLLDYGARQVVFAEQLPFAETGEAAFAGYGYQAAEFRQVLEGKVQFINTRNRGAYPSYATVRVRTEPELAAAWEVNRAYADTDVLISLGKLKSHVSAGVTGGLKNLFGVPPSSLYGDDLDSEPDEKATGYRTNTMHNCTHAPRTSATYFNGKSVRGDHGFNVPRFIVDLAGAFPIALTVIDGISTIQTAEGWWIGSMVTATRPGLLIAGRNPVCTDAVAAAVMGFDPDVADRTWPFANGTNHLALARHKGVGENRVRELEIVGVGLEAARFHFQPTFRRIAPTPAPHA